VALLFHRVGSPAGDPARELVPALDTAIFDAQMHHIRTHYDAVAASELHTAAAHRRAGDRYPVAVTFDDDLASHAETAAPILKRHGIPATFFLCGASLDQPYEFPWERLQRAVDRGLVDASVLDALGFRQAGSTPPILDLWVRMQNLAPADRDAVAARLEELAGPAPPDAGLRRQQIQHLIDAGFEIGFHTLRHYALARLNREQLAQAMTEGREQLEEVAGRKLTTIAYPHGSASAEVAAAARDAGFEYGFTTNHDPVFENSNPLLLGRLVEQFSSAGALASRLVRVLGQAHTRRV
jgi:peptidoglycan/xylan/chitin deacetylase (PgdA/CDA1 family)